LIVSLIVEETNLIDSITTTIVFEDAKQKLRSHAQVKIAGGKSALLSYYSFSIPQ
jgi:hypothetical protein